MGRDPIRIIVETIQVVMYSMIEQLFFFELISKTYTVTSFLEIDERQPSNGFIDSIWPR